MKKLSWMLVLISFIALNACEDESSKESNEENIPTEITEKGFLGSWGLNTMNDPNEAPVISKAIYVEQNRSTFANWCTLSGETVTAVVNVSSKLSGNILRINDNATKIVELNGESCAVSVTKNAIYGLNLTSEVTLNVTNGGTTKTYSRLKPVDD